MRCMIYKNQDHLPDSLSRYEPVQNDKLVYAWLNNISFCPFSCQFSTLFSKNKTVIEFQYIFESAMNETII